MLKIRSGIGYDIHRIEPGNGLKLGGILVADDIQFVAHSDGDVLIHAIIDSLLGVIGEKDIGELAPGATAQARLTITTKKTARVAKLTPKVTVVDTQREK